MATARELTDERQVRGASPLLDGELTPQVEGADAPGDLDSDETGLALLPPALAARLATLKLI